MQIETLDGSSHRFWDWKIMIMVIESSIICTQELWWWMKSKIIRNFEVTRVKIIWGGCWFMDGAGLQAKWRPLLKVHVILHWWLAPHRFQAKIIHGCSKSDFPFKGGIYTAWLIHRCQRLEVMIGVWTSYLVNQLCWLFKERNW